MAGTDSPQVLQSMRIGAVSYVMPGEILQRPSQMPCGSGDRCVACPEWATLDLASKSMNFYELRSRNTKEHFWTLQDVFRPRHRDCSIPWLRPPPASAKDKVAKVCWCTGFTLAWPKLPVKIISGIYGNKGWRMMEVSFCLHQLKICWDYMIIRHDWHDDIWPSILPRNTSSIDSDAAKLANTKLWDLIFLGCWIEWFVFHPWIEC